MVWPLDESQESSPLQGHGSWLMCEVAISVALGAHYSSSTHTNFLVSIGWQLATMICAIRSPHVIILTFDAICDIYYQNNKI